MIQVDWLRRPSIDSNSLCPQVLPVLGNVTVSSSRQKGSFPLVLQAAWLGMLATGGPKYTEWALGTHSLLDTLYHVPSCKLSVGHLFECLPHLQPRMYSLSSSPLYHPGEAHLTVAEVRREHESFRPLRVFAAPVRFPLILGRDGGAPFSAGSIIPISGDAVPTRSSILLLVSLLSTLHVGCT